MRIGIQTWGSRGDIDPFVALAGGLAAAGHSVTLAVTTEHPEDYAPLAARLGVKLVPVVTTFEHAPVEVLRQIVRTRNQIEELRLLTRYYFDPVVEPMYEVAKQLCADSDLVIGHFWVHPLATAAALARVPRVAVHLCPISIPSRERSLLGRSLGPWINTLVWRLADRVSLRLLFDQANALRRREGLRPIVSPQRELLISQDLTLVAVSPALCSRPADWGDHIEITGTLARAQVETRAAAPAVAPVGAPTISARAATPAHAAGAATDNGLDDGLSSFLEAGEPPIYFTFGSCDLFYGPENAALFIETARLLDARAIVQTRDSSAVGERDPALVHVVEQADHRRVFPRCRIVVHHGGAGTTQAALRAGRPSIVVEHGFDQRWWGRALVNAGASPRLLHRRSVTAARLADTVDEASRAPDYARAAARLGAQFAREDGVRGAVEAIERRFG